MALICARGKHLKARCAITSRSGVPTSDAPREYHIACGLAVIAATIENRVYLPFGGDSAFPNVGR